MASAKERVSSHTDSLPTEYIETSADKLAHQLRDGAREPRFVAFVILYSADTPAWPVSSL